jgi:hypothetical protein
MSAQVYRFVVEGELGARYASAFEDMSISAHDGLTEITGSIIDQSQLQGLIERIASLGLRLRSITPRDPENAEAATHNHHLGSATPTSGTTRRDREP